MFTNSNFTVWPILVSINEVKPDDRSDFVLLHSLWFESGKPDFDTLMRPYIAEMKSLFNNGVDWVSESGDIHTCKYVTLISSVETVGCLLVQCLIASLCAKQSKRNTHYFPLVHHIGSQKNLGVRISSQH